MGHGHVVPNPDGSKTRCGGPTICPTCALELARQTVMEPPSPGFFSPTPMPRAHHCKLPEPRHPPCGWRCYCGKAYLSEMLEHRDVNEGELPYQWRRAPHHDGSN